MPNICCGDKSAFEFWATVIEPYKPVFKFVFFVGLGATTIPKGAYQPWDHFSWLANKKMQSNY